MKTLTLLRAISPQKIFVTLVVCLFFAAGIIGAVHHDDGAIPAVIVTASLIGLAIAVEIPAVTRAFTKVFKPVGEVLSVAVLIGWVCLLIACGLLMLRGVVQL